jgi:hypothetical protein
MLYPLSYEGWICGFVGSRAYRLALVGGIGWAACCTAVTADSVHDLDRPEDHRDLVIDRVPLAEVTASHGPGLFPAFAYP